MQKKRLLALITVTSDIANMASRLGWKLWNMKDRGEYRSNYLTFMHRDREESIEIRVSDHVHANGKADGVDQEYVVGRDQLNKLKRIESWLVEKAGN